MAENWSALYEDPIEYDRTTAAEQDVGYFVERAKRSGGPVLELACGTGRLTIPIALAGIEAFGLDASKNMLAHAREKAEACGAKVQWLHGDFRHFKIDRKFSMIFLAYHSIHHVNDSESFTNLFAQIREHLTPDGLLVIEDWNPTSPSFDLGLKPGERSPAPEDVSSFNRMRWYDGDPGQSMAFFYPAEYRLLLEKNGFQIENIFGGLDQSAYRPEAPRLIVECRLREFRLKGAQPPVSTQPRGGAFSLTPAFWDKFKEEYWLKDRPTVIKNPTGAPLLSHAEILDGFRTFKKSLKGSDNPGPLRVFRGHEPIHQGIAPWLPLNTPGDAKDTEQTLEHYMQRMAEQAKPAEIFVTLSTLQCFSSFSFWSRLCDFLSGIYSTVGMPTGRTSAEIFFGNYKQTSFGIHQDKASVFCFVISGKKKMRLWPHESIPQAGNPYPGIADYADILDRSILLEGEPGDILFWPSTYWHVGEGDGDFNVSLSLALYHDWGQSIFHTALENLRYYLTFGVMDQKHSAPAMMKCEPELTQENLAESCESFFKFLKSQQFDRELQSYWLDKLTSFSLVPRPKLESSLPECSALVPTSAHPILARCFDLDLYVSSNGHSHIERISGPEKAGLVELRNAFAKLNGGESVSRSEFYGREELLQFLWKTEAVTPYKPS